MNPNDHASIVTIAMMAALADGRPTAEERAQLTAVATRLGLPSLDAVGQQILMGDISVAEVAGHLSDDQARQLAYETALAVCHADGEANALEQRFLDELRHALGLSVAAVQGAELSASAVASAAAAAPVAEVAAGQPPSDADLDDLILRQAMLAGALEFLPDKLANLAIIPLQLRLVYQIGQRYGQPLDAAQVKDLAGTLGIGAAAQVMEGVLRKVLGRFAGTLLGDVLGGATGLAAGAAVSFASTYALGHVAKRYYAQGRTLSADDLRSLFARFQEEARGLFPTLQDTIQGQASTLDLKALLGSLKAGGAGGAR